MGSATWGITGFLSYHLQAAASQLLLSTKARSASTQQPRLYPSQIVASKNGAQGELPTHRCLQGSPSQNPFHGTCCVWCSPSGTCMDSGDLQGKAATEMSIFTFPTIQNFYGLMLISSFVVLSHFILLRADARFLRTFMDVVKTVAPLT